MLLVFQDKSTQDESDSFVDKNDFDDDDTSWGGVVFQADDIDETDAKKKPATKPARFSVKKSVDEKVIRCKIVEVDELDTDEEELPCVVGLAATPPQASVMFRPKKKPPSRLKMFESVSVERKTSNGFVSDKNGFAGSKFWIGSSSSGSASRKKKASPKKK